jgi:hypothetical protein
MPFRAIPLPAPPVFMLFRAFYSKKYVAPKEATAGKKAAAPAAPAAAADPKPVKGGRSSASPRRAAAKG